MSTNTESDTDETEQNQNRGGSAVPSYRKEGQAEAVDKKRKEAARRERQEKQERAQTSGDARDLLASEDQPGADLPQPEVKTVNWRGTDLEFAEMGDALLKIVKFQSNDDQVGMLEYVLEMLDEKCLDPQANKAYWAQFNLRNGDDDPMSLMELFNELIGGEVTPEEREQIEEFRAGE